MATGSVIRGVLVLSRYGDRTESFQNPRTYDASGTVLTPLGQVQEYQLGRLLWQTYFNASSLSSLSNSNPLSGLLSGGALLFEADAGDEGNVIYDSAVALSQGMWPPLSKGANITLANGTRIATPWGGGQYVPITAVNPSDDVSFEGWIDCPTLTEATNAFYTSPGFKKVAADNAAFLASLSQYVGSRSTNLTNMMNIYDYLNVLETYNSAFISVLPQGVLTKARQLANYHESGVFSSPNLSSIQNVPGRAILPKLLNSINRLSDMSDSLRFHSMTLSYEPFLSLLSMLGLAESNANLSGIINYAGAAAFEVRTDPSGHNPFIRFLLKNGTLEPQFTTYGLFGGSPDISLKSFQSLLQPYSLSTVSSWCYACNNNFSRGCEANSTIPGPLSIPTHKHDGGSDNLSAVGAGFIGAGVTLFLALLLVTICMMSGMLTLGRRGRRVSAVVSAPGHHPRRGSDFKDGVDDDDVQLRKWDRVPEDQKSAV